MGDIKIDDIRRQLADIAVRNRLTNPESQPASGSQGPDFAQMLENAITQVNGEQKQAEQSMQDYISGKDPNLHNTLIALEKADVSFKLMMQVRGKLLEAYQEIMRTNV